MKKKYYAVAKGKTPGIYFTWDDCRAQVEHFSGAAYKSFENLAQAEAFVRSFAEEAEENDAGAAQGTDETFVDTAGNEKEREDEMFGRKQALSVTKEKHLVAYVDGSYEHSKRAYSYGCVLVFADEVIKLSGKGNNEEFVNMRNVAGEIQGSECAIQWAVDNGYEEITIYYDYEGIEKWATGEWKAAKTGTIAYKKFIEEKKKDIIIHFEKVAAHTGVEYNEMADELAKAALGI